MKRLLATVAAVGISLSTATALAPTSQAQGLGDALALISVVNGNIATADCGLVRGALTGLGLVNGETTRGQLVADLGSRVGDDLPARLLTAQTINEIGDRALECGVVKPDPQPDLLALLLGSSSGQTDPAAVLAQLSSR